MTGWLAFCVLARPGTLTHSCPATPVKDVVAVWAARTGLPLSVNSKLGDRFVIVRLRDEPVDELITGGLTLITRASTAPPPSPA